MFSACPDILVRFRFSLAYQLTNRFFRQIEKQRGYTKGREGGRERTRGCAPWTNPVLTRDRRLATRSVRYGENRTEVYRDDKEQSEWSSITIHSSSVTEWVSVYGLTSHSTHNRSFQRRVFPGNQLHWYWQPKTIKHNTTYTRNTKENQKKTALANKTIYTLICYAFYDL